ncbi:MAG: formylglycine-generating enzyme family protein, partial [Anaerolineae bacterium]
MRSADRQSAGADPDARRRRDRWRRAGQVGRSPTGRRHLLLSPWRGGAGGGVGRRYPWGDAWRADHGNIKETGIEETNPVGSFPQGLSPYGVLEMSGNVWEWTRSRWGERSVTQPDYGYPYDATDGRERLEDMKIPILRGGSWAYHRQDARCAYRGRSVPVNSDDLGFRVVVSLVTGRSLKFGHKNQNLVSS